MNSAVVKDISESIESRKKTDLELAWQLRNDEDYARLFVEFLCDDYINLIDDKKCKWLKWNGNVWVDDGKEQIKEVFPEFRKHCIQQRNAGKLYVEDKKIIAIGNASKIKKILEMTKSIGGFHKKICSEMDNNLDLLNLWNSTLDLKTLEIRKQKKEDLLTNRMSIEYDKDAKCELFKQTLLEIFEGDEDIIRFIQILFGYLLTGDRSQQKFYVFSGEGANGKSLLADVISMLVR